MLVCLLPASPALAAQNIPQAPSYWPGSTTSMGDDGGHTSSKYANVSITAAEYPEAGDLVFYNGDASLYPQNQIVKVIEIPGADGSDPAAFELTLTVQSNIGENVVYHLEKANYYLPVPLVIQSKDGRQCTIFIIAIPQNRDFDADSQLEQYLPAGEKYARAVAAISALYYKLLKEYDFPAVVGGAHPDARRSLITLYYGMRPYFLHFADKYRSGSGYSLTTFPTTAQEGAVNLVCCNCFSPAQAEAIFDTVFSYYLDYAARPIEPAQLTQVVAGNSRAAYGGDNIFTLYLPENLDMNKVRDSVVWETLGNCVISSSGAWKLGSSVFVQITARDPATDTIYNSDQNGKIQTQYILKLRSGEPVFGIASFEAGGRSADIDFDGNIISLHLATDVSFMQTPAVSYTGTGLKYLDAQGDELTPDAQGAIDLSLVKTLVVVNDFSAMASSSGGSGFVREKSYALNVTQGNSDQCEMRSFSLGVEGESVTWNGMDIGVVIPYATDWASLAADIVTSYDATVQAAGGEDFEHSAQTPVVYRVTAQNGIDFKDYSVTVTKVLAATGKRITSFAYGSLQAQVDHDAGTIALELPSGSSKVFAPDIETDEFAVVEPASGVQRDFTNPLEYTVTAQDGEEKTYTVSVTVSSSQQPNPRQAQLESLRNGIITAYRSSAEDDWEWLNLGVYEGIAQNGNNGFSIAQHIGELVLNENGKLTDIARVIIMLTARGYDCSNLAQYNGGTPFRDKAGNNIDNLVASIYNSNKTYAIPVVVNGTIFALIALDSGNYTLPENAKITREGLLEYLLSHVYLSDGFGLDMVGMLMYGIGPYQEDALYGTRVRAKMQQGVDLILSEMRADYTFKSWGTINSEVTAQAICALASAGIDCAADPRFGTADTNVLTQWLDLFAVGTSGFRHTADTDLNSMATYEACYALQWYLGFLENGGAGNRYYMYYHMFDFSEPLSAEANILSFALEAKQGQISEGTDGGRSTIAVTLPTGTPLGGMRPELTLSEGAALISPLLPVSFVAGVEQPFTVIAADGVTMKTYYVTVSLSDDVGASGAELNINSIALEDANQMERTILQREVAENDASTDILLTVNVGVDVTRLRIGADISYGATAAPALDLQTVMDLSDWTTFTVTSGDGLNSVVYRIKVQAKRYAAIERFTLDIGGVSYTGAIAYSSDGSTGTISVTNVPSTANVKALAPEITLSDGTSVCTPLPLTPQNFSVPVIYTVSGPGAGLVSRTYTVRVTDENGNFIGGGGGTPTETAPRITGFVVLGAEGVIDESLGTITVQLPQGTNVSAVAPAITATQGSDVSPMPGEVVDLSTPVVYTVTLGTETRSYVVSVTYFRSISQQLWDELADSNTVRDHQVSHDPSGLSGRRR